MWCRAARNTRSSPRFRARKQMLDLFSDQLGVPYPWAQYAQTSVDDFVEGGMENTSATTLTSRGLVNPALAPEIRQGARRSGFARAGAPVVRRSGHVQRLGEPLAERRLRHLFRALLGRAALRRRRSRLRILARSSQLVPAEALVSRAHRHAQFHGFSIEYAGNIYDKGGLGAEDAARANSATRIFSAGCITIWKRIAGRTWSPRIWRKPSSKPPP